MRMALAIIAMGLAVPLTSAGPSARDRETKRELMVGDVSGLSRALGEIAPGGTILLNPGTYSGLEVRGVSFDKPVTIRSAKLSERAVITNFDVAQSKGLHFAELELVALGPQRRAFSIIESADIRFSKSYFHGSLDGNPSNDGQGLSIIKSSGVVVEGSGFREFFRAVVATASNDVILKGNEFRDIRTTGFMGAQMENLRIVSNRFSNFWPQPGDHPDAIQLITAGTEKPTKNVLIEGNVIWRDQGLSTQGIFLRDQVGTLPYEDVQIRENLVLGTGYGGIYVIGARRLSLNDNELFSLPGKTNRTWMMVVNADDVVATRNRAVTISFDGVTNLKAAKNEQNKPLEDGGAELFKQRGKMMGGASVLPPL